MAASPDFKIYDHAGRYQAATKDLAAAAVLMAFYGDSATIRYGHKSILWHEGKEEQQAGESYDYVCEVAQNRLQKLHAVAYEKVYGS